MSQRASRHGRLRAERPLTPRELEVLAQLRTGVGNRDIAQALGIGEWTVKAYLTSIYRKLHVHNRTQAAHASSIGEVAMMDHDRADEYARLIAVRYYEGRLSEPPFTRDDMEAAIAAHMRAYAAWRLEEYRSRGEAADDA